MLSGNSLRQTVHTRCASVHQAAKLVAALLRVAGVTAGEAKSNGSLRLFVTRQRRGCDFILFYLHRLLLLFTFIVFVPVHVLLTLYLEYDL